MATAQAQELRNQPKKPYVRTEIGRLHEAVEQMDADFGAALEDMKSDTLKKFDADRQSMESLSSLCALIDKRIDLVIDQVNQASDQARRATEPLRRGFFGRLKFIIIGR